MQSLRKSIALLVLALLIPFSSCKKFVEIPNPDNQVVSSAVFADDKTATSAVLGLYSQMVSGTLSIMGGGLSFYGSLSSDDLLRNTSTPGTDAFQNNALTADNNDVQSYFWRYGYLFIYQANSCIEGLQTSTNLTEATRTQLTGEVLFLRAITYFYLINLFGDVPLIVKTDYQTSINAPRTPIADVYSQIITDLKQSESLLPVAYPSANQVRANKYAASALLSRVYLYTKEYVDAEAEATAVINSGTYSLLTDLNGVFLITSKEAIWQQYSVFTSSTNTFEGGNFVPALATIKPTYSVRNELVASFEPNDKRKTSWIGANTVSGVTYYYPYKYKVRSSTTKTEFTVVLRYAELFLIRAEARVFQNKLTDAVSDINVIRQRAGLPNLSSTLSQPDCVTAIQKEYRSEFFTEWGQRWFNLRRSGNIDAVLGALKPTWKSYQALYPIPSSEIKTNPFLTQNPGY